jgi:hypothetical protein
MDLGKPDLLYRVVIGHSTRRAASGQTVYDRSIDRLSTAPNSGIRKTIPGGAYFFGDYALKVNR